LFSLLEIKNWKISIRLTMLYYIPKRKIYN
jgi:hypothetical protein